MTFQRLWCYNPKKERRSKMITTKTPKFYVLFNSVFRVQKRKTAHCPWYFPFLMTLRGILQKKRPRDCEKFCKYRRQRESERGCQALAQNVRFPTSQFTYNRDVGLIIHAQGYAALEKFVPFALCTGINYPWHHQTFEMYPGKHRRYGKMMTYFFWPYVETNIHLTVNDCGICAKNGSNKKRRSGTIDHSAAGPAEFWPSISWDHFQKLLRVNSTWWLWLTVTRNVPAPFPRWRLNQLILGLYFLIIGYYHANAQTRFSEITTQILSAYSFRHYEDS